MLYPQHVATGQQFPFCQWCHTQCLRVCNDTRTSWVAYNTDRCLSKYKLARNATIEKIQNEQSYNHREYQPQSRTAVGGCSSSWFRLIIAFVGVQTSSAYICLFLFFVLSARWRCQPTSSSNTKLPQVIHKRWGDCHAVARFPDLRSAISGNLWQPPNDTAKKSSLDVLASWFS